MSASRVAAIAAVSATVLWGVKALVIWAAGGLDESALEGPLFVLGLLALAAAWAALFVALAGTRALPIRLAAAVLGAVAGLAVMIVCDALGDAVVPSSAGWVEEEAGLWLAAAVTVALALWRLRRSERGRTRSA